MKSDAEVAGEDPEVLETPLLQLLSVQDVKSPAAALNTSAAAAGDPPPQPSQVWDARAIPTTEQVSESARSYTRSQTLGEQGNLSQYARMHVHIRRTMDPPAPSQCG